MTNLSLKHLFSTNTPDNEILHLENDNQEDNIIHSFRKKNVSKDLSLDYLKKNINDFNMSTTFLFSFYSLYLISLLIFSLLTFPDIHSSKIYMQKDINWSLITIFLLVSTFSFLHVLEDGSNNFFLFYCERKKYKKFINIILKSNPEQLISSIKKQLASKNLEDSHSSHYSYLEDSINNLEDQFNSMITVLELNYNQKIYDINPIEKFILLYNKIENNLGQIESIKVINQV